MSHGPLWEAQPQYTQVQLPGSADFTSTMRYVLRTLLYQKTYVR